MAKKVNTKKTKIKSTTERLRLSLYKSNVSTYAQVIDDEKNLTKIGVLIKKTKGKTKVQSAVDLGKLVAEKAKEAGIEKIVFDRGRSPYKGRVKAFAESARKNGLKF